MRTQELRVHGRIIRANRRLRTVLTRDPELIEPPMVAVGFWWGGCQNYNGRFAAATNQLQVCGEPVLRCFDIC